ncbi:hypothetical protein KTH73_04195 [Acinetobacter courvalinii]|uniref:GrlR family regulatory protein n=1 Tax=Acinetobacter TaxID=469 RepID=UPI00051902CD|nr:MULTISPECIES: GrlR family regulatory protein [Acinetobacter]MBJ9956132.1 hypothetical protein [Acinetobacter courvalinii]MCU4367489.1 hypothetical protein [Acinetobacter courvalinii]MCU4389928.1 hypothetical protein [Acinetobacter courvalinii]MCU4445695.1 hypothetical protein [Acinetobacter courvalinii]MCU4576093.1 hypothetical protein [Acinetobacter courvalinii]
MKDGIYLLTFKSSDKDFGNGILVVDDEIADGGDTTYSYNGYIEENRLILSLSKHNINVHSLFGGSGSLKLNLTFQEDNQGYMLHGNVENLQTVPLLVQAKLIGKKS